MGNSPAVLVKMRNHDCRITTNLYLGEIPAVVLENEKIRITVLVGRGADVVEFLYKPKDMDFVWLTSRGLPSKAPSPDHADDVDSFLDGYPGGWQTIFPNGGAPCEYRGLKFGQHAEVAILPWDYSILEDSPNRISICFSVETKKLPFRVQKTIILESKSNLCLIEEKIENLSSQSFETMWGSHISFGAPFLSADSFISISEKANVIPDPEAITPTGRRVGTLENFSWPIGRGPDGAPVDFSQLPTKGTNSEMLYINSLAQGWFRVDTPSKGLAAEVTWDQSLLPYLWYWQEFGSSSEYPWFGKHYNIGLEPFSSFPTHGLAEAVKNGSALKFAPFEIKKNSLTYKVLELI